MPAVIMGALSFRRRNPHRFLMRTCQVSIKEVPSPPQVSIEIELTNKNSLAALFTQSGMLLYCILLLSISESLCLSHGCDWTLAKIQCHNLIWTFCCEEHHFLEAFKWFAFIHLMCLCTACVQCTHYMRDQSPVVRQWAPGFREIKARWVLSRVFQSKWEWAINVKMDQ